MYSGLKEPEVWAQSLQLFFVFEEQRFCFCPSLRFPGNTVRSWTHILALCLVLWCFAPKLPIFPSVRRKTTVWSEVLSLTLLLWLISAQKSSQSHLVRWCMRGQRAGDCNTDMDLEYLCSQAPQCILPFHAISFYSRRWGKGCKWPFHWLSLGSDPGRGLRENSVGTSTHRAGACDMDVSPREPQNLFLANPHSPFFMDLQNHKYMPTVPIWCSYMSWTWRARLPPV